MSHPKVNRTCAVIFSLLLFSRWMYAEDPAPLPEPETVDSGGGGSSSGIVGTQGTGGTPSGAGSADNMLFTGSFLYNVPLEVPPGIAGMEPKLSLQYNSSLGNGWVGVGWDLSLGSILRSTKNGVPKYDGSDTFLLMTGGQTQELVKIPDGTYRAKIESAFQRFVFQNGTWIVTDKSGMRMYFGQTAASQLGSVYLWALDKVVDRNGNTLVINYEKSLSDNQLYPKEILYTGNDAAGRAADRKVVFTLEGRSDVLSGYRPGFQITTSKRLSAVDTYVYKNGAWVHASMYQLSYLTRSDTNRSLLKDVTLTGYDGTQTQSITIAKFNYPAQTAGFTASSGLALPGPFSTGANEWIPTQCQLIDMDANTFPDFAFAIAGTRNSYMNNGNSFQDNANWKLPVDLVLGNWIPNGAQFLELNGDGRPDLIFGRCCANTFAWLNSGSGWATANQWALPIYTRDTNGGEVGARFIDLNGDGRDDLVNSYRTTPTSGLGSAAWINTGSGWQLQSGWALPEALVVAGKPISQLVDLNGDHRPDFVTAPYNGSHRTWINTGSGWSEQAQWALPENLNNSTKANDGVRFVDVNGDGLPDLVAAWDPGADYFRTYLNTGNGWSEKPQWRLPNRLAAGVTAVPLYPVFQDINGDGLVDFLTAYYSPGGNIVGTWLNTGSGWSSQKSEWAAPQGLGVSGFWAGSQMVDLNGDQLADFAISYLTPGGGQFQGTWLSNAAPHGDLLASVENAFGGKTLIEYEKSSAYSNTFLPFPMWLVKSITRQGGNPNGPDVVTRFNYVGGLFDMQEKEFLGFRQVETIDSDGNKSVSTFFQKKNVLNQDVPANALKGRIQKVENYGASGNLLTVQETAWSYITPFAGVYFVRPTSMKNTVMEVSPNLITQVDYFYDDAPAGPGVGNVIRTVNQGDMALSGDERTEEIAYASGSADLKSFPKSVVVRDASGARVSETQYFYDGATSLDVISKGNVTKISRWLHAPNAADRWIDTNTSYNSLGQPTDMEDALHHHVGTTYDAFGFPATVTNALSQTVSSVYDPLTGDVLSDTDPNGQTTSYRYDPLGRRTKVIGPLDSDAFPTTFTDYHDETRGNPSQQNIETQSRITQGQAPVLWSKSYFDGMGRSYRSEQSDIGSTFVITETIYDSRGLAIKSSVPRLNSPATAPLWTQTSYDAQGRVTQTLRPDGTFTTTSYRGLVTSVQDPNGKVQSSEVDSYGRIIHRWEPDVATPTEYAYDPLGRLIQVTDSQGKRSSFAYDSFGRKLAMTDPNAGTWSYAYDDNGNLLEQTDARGVKLAFTYDALNRAAQKRLAADPQFVTGQEIGSSLSNYTYDVAVATAASLWPYEQGRLTAMTDPSGETRFYHDRLGRVVREVKLVNGISYETLTEYDALSRVTRIIYPSSRVARYNYDEAGRLSQVTNDDGSVVYASYPSYNALGQPLVRRQNNDFTETQYQYHPTKFTLSRLVTGTHPAGGAAQSLQDLSYTFDPAGNITAIADAVHSDRSQTFSYDNLYRLTHAVGAYGDESFSYDGLGNFTVKNGIEYLYGDPNHPYAVTETRPTQRLAVDASTVLAWDLEPTEPILGSTGTIGAPQFTTGRYRQGLLLNGTTDAFKIPNTTDLNLPNFTLMIWIKPTGLPASGFATIMVKGGDAAINALPRGFRLALNPAGKLVFELGHLTTSLTLRSSNPLPLNRWTFITATYNGTIMKLFLDGVLDTTLATSAAVQPNDRPVTLGASLTSEDAASPGTFYRGVLDDPRIHNRAWTGAEISAAFAQYQNIATYYYDANGNLRLKSIGNVSSTYQFNAEARLASVKQGTTTIASYLYDGAGGRVQKTVSSISGAPAGTTLYIGKMFEVRPNGSQVTHIYGGSDLICDLVKPVSGPTQVYYVHGDHLGSTSLVTYGPGAPGTNAALAEETVYDPFGATFSSTGDSPLMRKYTGQEEDPETHLYYYNARYYDPALGRFTSADSIVPSAGDPQSFNRYAYCRNNPLLLSDPSGNSWLSKAVGKVGSWINDHSEIAGLGLQVFDPIAGSVLLAQTQNGRAILAGQGVVAASFATGGTAAGWGAITGEASAAYTANKTGQNMMRAVIFGGIEGAALAASFARVDALTIAKDVPFNPVANVILKANIIAIAAGAHGGDAGRAWGTGAVVAGLNIYYQTAVGHSADPSPGVESKNATYDTIRPPEGYDVVGKNEVPNGNWFHDNFTIQGSPVMRIVNAIPGGNQFAQLHDTWMNTITGMPNFASMPVAAAVSYGASLGGDFAALTVDIAAH